MVTLSLSSDFVNVVDNLEAVTVRPPEGENAGSELVANGRFDTSLGDWTPSGMASWEERLALLQAATAYLAQSLTTVAGTTYLAGLDAFAAWTTTAPVVRIGTSANGTQIGTEALTESKRLQFAFTATGAATWLTLRNGDGTARYGNITVKATGDTAVANALRRAVSNREAAASEGQYRMGDVKWHLPKTQITAPPALGSIVIDGDATRWTVLAVDQETFNTRWKCWCRKLSTANVGLGTVTIQKRRMAKDVDGAATGTLVDWATHVRAKIQRESTANATQETIRRTPRLVSIHFEQQFPLDERFAVRADDGRLYKITGYRDWQKIDGLFAVDAEESPWPLN